jgi:surfeit locus 1 family protein
VSHARAAIFAGAVFVLGAVCVRLGIWQLARLEERRSHNAAMEARLAQPYLHLQGDVSDIESLLYRRVIARGQFDPSREVVLLNRAMDEEPGVHLVTPLRLADGSGAILVDRGWIPIEDNTPDGLAAYAAEGIVEVRGIVLGTEEEPFWSFLADRTPGPGQQPLREWRVLNVEGIQAQVPYVLLPVYLQLSEAPEGTQPVPDARIDLSDGPHLGYAIQWFAFAATAFVGGGAWLHRKLKGK